MAPPPQVRTDVDFCIEVGFTRESEGPARVFKAMTGLIESFQAIDRLLVKSIDTRIEPILLLEDIEAGSIRTWLRQQLLEAEDESLKKLDWKPIVGRYLVKAKHLAVNFLGKRTTISNRSEIVDLQRELLTEAERVQVNPIPIHTPLSESDIVRMLRLLNDPLAELRPGDSVKYITSQDEASFTIGFNFAPEAIEQLITKETLESESVMILKVKRPDYLGQAMWEFRYEGHPIEAKFLDVGWLRKFQEREVDVRPGDALRANVKVAVRYGYDGEVVGKHHSIVKVIEVMRLKPPQQSSFLPAP